MLQVSTNEADGRLFLAAGGQSRHWLTGLGLESDNLGTSKQGSHWCANELLQQEETTGLALVGLLGPQKTYP